MMRGYSGNASITLKTAWLTSLLLCREVVSQTDLKGGIITRTDVKEYADLALDVRDIRSLAKSGQKSQVLGLYEEGEHSEITPGFRYSLKKMSDDLVDANPRTPHLLFHLYGLADLATNVPLLSEQSRYADGFIRDMINSNIDLAADSVVALIMWMYGTHLLWSGVKTCELRTAADNPDMIPLGDGGMDEFIALWIGTDQQPGTGDGHSLYAWAHAAGDKFGVNSPEAIVNSRIKLLYQEGATALSLKHACTKDNKQTQQQLWNVATRMTNEMVKPLFQWLTFHIVEEKNPDAVTLYALALVPQLARCRPSIYKRLKENLIDRSINFDLASVILEDLQEAYACFGFACEDIGMGSGFRSRCDLYESQRSLAGYRPTSDVFEISRIDLDIHQLRILTTLESWSFAKSLYLYGSNVPGRRESENDPFHLISLSQLAISSERRDADPVYNQFVSYFNDQDYADTTITAALDGTGKWGIRTTKERAELIALTSSFEVVYMDIIRNLNNAVAACNVADPSAGFSFTGGDELDQAAAMIIGSMEGTNFGGSSDLDDGQLLWNLANTRAFQFQTMNNMDYAVVNSELVDLLYAAKGELDAVVCPSLERTVLKIQQLMTVAVMQSVIRSAIAADGILSTSSDLSLVGGEVFARSVLPIINAHDPSTAELISENMIIKVGVNPVRDGKEVVADGFGFSITQGIKLSCSYLGATSTVDPCRRFGGGISSSTRLATHGLLMGTLLLAFTLV